MYRFSSILLIGISFLISSSTSQNTANNKLSISLLDRLSVGQDRNYVISPLSLTLGLGMLYEGLGDSSRVQMERLLDISPSTFVSKFKGLSSVSNSPSIDLGNLIIMDNSSVPRDTYIESIRNNFQATPFVQPFSSSDPRRIENKVNKWVASKTNEKIQNFLVSGSIDESTKVLLVNVLSFQDDWDKPFSTDLTHNGDFTLSSGQTIQIPMMNGEMRQIYAMKQNGLSICVLPFKNDSSISMAFVLPDNENQMIEALKTNLLDTLLNYKNKMRLSDVRIEMPKFKFSTRTEMGEHLEALGLTDIFTPKADFSRMAVNSNKLLVSSIFQKTDIEVNEIGVAAVAASGIMVTTYSLFVPDLEIRFNKPFFAFINKGEHVLFAGQIVNP